MHFALVTVCNSFEKKYDYKIRFKKKNLFYYLSLRWFSTWDVSRLERDDVDRGMTVSLVSLMDREKRASAEINGINPLTNSDDLHHVSISPLPDISSLVFIFLNFHYSWSYCSCIFLPFIFFPLLPPQLFFSSSLSILFLINFGSLNSPIPFFFCHLSCVPAAVMDQIKARSSVSRASLHLKTEETNYQ